MSADYSYNNVLAAKVVVKALHRARGDEPVAVMLALDPATKEEQWVRVARAYLVEANRRRHYGLPPVSPRDVHDLTAVPEEWDELAGERPGEDDPLLAFERKQLMKFYVGGSHAVQRQGQEAAEEVTLPAEGRGRQGQFEAPPKADVPAAQSTGESLIVLP